jgi:hypothetical protein
MKFELLKILDECGGVFVLSEAWGRNREVKTWSAKNSKPEKNVCFLS